MTSAVASTHPPVARIQPAPIAQTSAMTLGDAISILTGQEHSPSLIAAETFFLKRLMNELDAEEKAECYYYLLRCRVARTAHYETPDIRGLYKKMHEVYVRAEREVREEVRRGKSPIARIQMRAFYQLAIYHYTTIENVFLERGFEDAARIANEHKMELRRRSYAADRRVGHTLAYTLVGLTSRYGNSFVRWGATTLLSILGFAFVYFLIDQFVSAEDRIISAAEPLFTYAYFSVVTFMTLGYGDIHPNTVEQMAAASIEVILGYFMLGVLINMMHRQA